MRHNDRVALRSLLPDRVRSWARTRLRRHAGSLPGAAARAIGGAGASVVEEIFDEAGYLEANPDVAAAVTRGDWSSGRAHFEQFGHAENRPMGNHADSGFDAAKARKLQRISPLLKRDLPHIETPLFFDFLTDDLRAQFAIVDDGPVSSNDYDADALQLFSRHANGLVLDMGAGHRRVYLENVVNFEIAPFRSTDVRGVAESLPFVDGAFDAVISIAVLEHVRDPFRAAAEMVRVLKPGGELICCVPFLQPLHGYPHHYYNMTHQGLRNLFEGPLAVDRITVPDSTSPIWSLTWILRNWADGLSDSARDEFLSLRVADLLGPPLSYMERPWVRQLSSDKNLELASACVLHGRKPDNH